MTERLEDKKIQMGFIQRIDEIRENYCPPSETEKLLLPLNPLDYVYVGYNLGLMENFKKSETNTTIMKMLALETIHNLYPDKEWIHFFTDGSLIGNCAGAAIYSTLFSFYLPLRQFQTNFDGELEAINIALQQLYCHLLLFTKVVVLSDSKSALELII